MKAEISCWLSAYEKKFGRDFGITNICNEAAPY